MNCGSAADAGAVGGGRLGGSRGLPRLPHLTRLGIDAPLVADHRPFGLVRVERHLLSLPSPPSPVGARCVVVALVDDLGVDDVVVAAGSSSDAPSADPAAAALGCLVHGRAHRLAGRRERGSRRRDGVGVLALERGLQRGDVGLDLRS